MEQAPPGGTEGLVCTIHVIAVWLVSVLWAERFVRWAIAIPIPIPRRLYGWGKAIEYEFDCEGEENDDCDTDEAGSWQVDAGV